MKTRIALALGTVATLFASSAFAQDVTASSEAPESKLSASAQLEMLPVGSYHISINDNSDSTDAAVAYGVSGAVEYAVHKNLSVGLAPQLTLNMISSEADDAGGDAASQLALYGRIRAHAAVAPKVEAFGYVQPGYAFVFPGDSDMDSDSGFALGFGAGARYQVAPKAFVSAELGYQMTFLSTEFLGQTADQRADLLHLGLGGGLNF